MFDFAVSFRAAAKGASAWLEGLLLSDCESNEVLLEGNKEKAEGCGEVVMSRQWTPADCGCILSSALCVSAQWCILADETPFLLNWDRTEEGRVWLQRVLKSKNKLPFPPLSAESVHCRVLCGS